MSDQHSNKTGDGPTQHNVPHIVDTPTVKATFAMACFWAPDSLFGATMGVIRTRVGYTGGTAAKPTYRNLGDHTEAIQIDYDPKTISYDDLLHLFWTNHNPVSNNKRQYASFIFFHTPEQKEVAERSLKEEQQKHLQPVTTQIKAATEFFDAEDYHQKYRLQQHPFLCERFGIKGDLLKTSTLAARLNGYVIGCGGVAQFESDLPSLGLDEKAADYVRNLVTRYEGHGLVC